MDLLVILLVFFWNVAFQNKLAVQYIEWIVNTLSKPCQTV